MFEDSGEDDDIKELIETELTDKSASPVSTGGKKAKKRKIAKKRKAPKSCKDKLVGFVRRT